mmetsp:Transcript_35446/g.68456  ORF Transcript_35446/g.68456 Transcript_35446/m.68456 type:complete len:305 (-) Transcript_35446:774-1688(-)
MLCLSASVGNPQYRDLSSRPGLRSAGSMRSGLLDAANTYTCDLPSTPSRWQSIWLTTRSVTPVESPPLAGQMASNSSKNNTHGRAASALAKASRTACSLAPIYLLRSSGPLMEMKCKRHSFATAEANSVFPQPGGPYKRIPDRNFSGTRAKRGAYTVGSMRVSLSVSLTCSSPPISFHVVSPLNSCSPCKLAGVNPSRPFSKSPDSNTSGGVGVDGGLPPIARIMSSSEAILRRLRAAAALSACSSFSSYHTSPSNSSPSPLLSSASSLSGPSSSTAFDSSRVPRAMMRTVAAWMTLSSSCSRS